MRVALTFIFAFTLTRCFCQDLPAIDKKLSNLYENIPDNYTDKQKNARLERFEKLLLKYTTMEPKTLNYPFKKLATCHLIYISTSEDRNFRIYSYDLNRQRSMPWFNNIYQFRTNGRVTSRHFEPPEKLVPDYTYYQVNDLVTGGKTYYIVQRVAIGGLLEEYSIKFFSIENGLLNDNIKLVKTENGMANVLPCSEVDASVENAVYKIVYNKKAGSISIPMTTKDGKVTGKRITYKFNGKYFVKN